jgi:hypothetical protein
MLEHIIDLIQLSQLSDFIIVHVKSKVQIPEQETIVMPMNSESISDRRLIERFSINFYSLPDSLVVVCLTTC